MASHAGGIIAAIFILVLLIVIVITAFYGYRVWKARKLGLPPPSINPFASQSSVPTRNYPAQGGVLGWVQSRFKQMRNKRTAGGGYESERNTRGFGPVDQDEGAWDPRMGHDDDGYDGPGRMSYEEQELGLASHHARGDSDASYMGGRGYGDVDTGYHAPRGLEETSGGHTRNISEYDASHRGAQSNPFADSAERSDMGNRGRSAGNADSDKRDARGVSPASERRSVFHEEV
ncbi:MAG: hypothetical protein Q9162_001782 [Coniocarpon cinnabarinum]